MHGGWLGASSELLPHLGLLSLHTSLTLSRHTVLLSRPQVWRVSFPDQTRHLERAASRLAQAAACAYCPEPPLFHRLFPYHFVVDQELRVVQVGVADGIWCYYSVGVGICLPATRPLNISSVSSLQLCLPAHSVLPVTSLPILAFSCPAYPASPCFPPPMDSRYSFIPLSDRERLAHFFEVPSRRRAHQWTGGGGVREVGEGGGAQSP